MSRHSASRCLRITRVAADRPAGVRRSELKGLARRDGWASHWDVFNSLMINNRAVGFGANPAQSGTAGGGSGGAIYTDGDNYNVLIAGTVIRRNSAREGGGAVFFVVDNNQGTLTIRNSTLHNNPSDEFSTAGFPGIFFHSSGHPIVTDSTIN